MSDLFKEKAKEWDTNDRSQQLSSGIGSAILENINLTQSMEVLDFGAGTGLITSQIAPFVKRVTAVDISESMLEKLRAKTELQEKVHVLCHDITVSRLNQEFDLIMSAMAMHHVKDTENMLNQFSKHLKQGGQIALADLDSEDGTFHKAGTEGVFHNGFDRTYFSELLNRHGFIDIKFSTALTVKADTGLYPVFLVVARKVAVTH